MHTSEALNDLVHKAVYHGLAVAVHAIGGAANRTVLDGASASGEEQLKGSLSPGKLAAFVVLSHGMTEGDEESLRSVRPNAVVVGGRTCYGEE